MNIQCELEKVQDLYMCKICKVYYPVSNPVNCRVKIYQHQNIEPSIAQKAVNFARAAVIHAAAGNPIVSKDVIKQRLDICKTCPLFKPNSNQAGGVCTHSSCGCGIQDNLNYLNKIAWADQECPTGLWGKENIGV